MTYPAILPEIPLIDLRHFYAKKIHPAVACIAPHNETGTPRANAQTRQRVKRLLKAGRMHFGPWLSPVLGAGMLVGDRFASYWMQQQDVAHAGYFPAIRALAKEIGHPGIAALNLSMELTACTSGVFSPDNRQMLLLRVLDWEMEGIAENTVILHEAHVAGEFYNITLPGFVGMLTGHAPGRFSVAINQAPGRRHWLPGAAGDFIGNKKRWLKSRGWMPSHLLRHVFETCKTYGEAVEKLSKEPLCTPTLFIIAGPYCNEGLVIERTEDAYYWRHAPDAAANHFTPEFQPQSGWRNRRQPSPLRQATLQSIWHEQAPYREHHWLQPPVLNDGTQLIVEACPHPEHGFLNVSGMENRRYATLPFMLRNGKVKPPDAQIPAYMATREVGWTKNR